MGYGEVIGNGSVHWIMVHEDQKTGAKMPLKLHTAASKLPAHRVRLHHEDRSAEGRDPISPAQIGKRKGHRGKFVVQIRYRTMAEARQAGDWVAQNVRPAVGGYVLSVTVPAITRGTVEENPPAEVRIDW
jgi:hypothetical protein